jgi:misacylated tRNA(Ala) deacylase
MTELLYMSDCYVKEFDASVSESGEGWVVLDKTAFYPEGGGQPTDTGVLKVGDKEVKVSKVKKDSGSIKHFVSVDIPTGTAVHGVLDWEPRYARMRMHSAQHLLSAFILDEYAAETVGCQIHEDESRLDFHPLETSEELIAAMTERFNKAVDDGVDILIRNAPREQVLQEVDEARRRLFSRIPESVKDIRVIEIPQLDKCPCGGTHVANTREIGHITITKVENKGKGRRRFYFTLSAPK